MESTLREYHSPRNFGVGTILPDCYLHIPLPIVTKHELGLPIPPCTNIFSYRGHRQTDRHTDTHTDHHR